LQDELTLNKVFWEVISLVELFGQFLPCDCM